MTDFNSTPSVRHDQSTGAIVAGGMPGGQDAPPIVRPAIPADETYLTTEQVAARYPGVSPRTVEGWRCVSAKRVGPPFIKVGLKAYYPLSLLIQWERANLTIMGNPTTH